MNTGMNTIVPKLAGWGLLIVLSGAATLSAWRAPTGYPAPVAPAPLPRGTPEERARIAELARSLERTLAALPPELSAEALEERAAIPDNPLVPGHGGLVVGCPPDLAPADVDWTWCPQTGRVVAGGLEPEARTEGGGLQ